MKLIPVIKGIFNEGKFFKELTRQAQKNHPNPQEFWDNIVNWSEVYGGVEAYLARLILLGVETQKKDYLKEIDDILRNVPFTVERQTDLDEIKNYQENLY